MGYTRFGRLAVWCLLPLVVACGETNRTTDPPEFAPPAAFPAILGFEASPDHLAPGASATLYWRTENADELLLADDQGTPISLEGTDPRRGAVQVQPTRTTTYTLTASGADGAPGPAWRTVTVTLDPAEFPAPSVEEFTASIDRVAVGGEVTLAWRTTDAARLTLKDDAGVAVDLGDASLDEGQVIVRPTRSPTTYALVATGPGGRDTAVATVDVVGLPRIARFFVDPLAPVGAGDTVALHWETQNADRVVIRRDGAEFLDTAETSGVRSLALDETSTFTLEATGPGGAAHATTVARVGPRVIAFAASERVVRAGDPVVLSWELADADRAVIDGPAGYHVALTGADLITGSATVDVTLRGDFVLRAFRRDVDAAGSVSVEVTEAPRVRAVSVDQAVVTAAADHPAVVVLSWVQDGADSCAILRGAGAVPGYEDFPCGGAGSAEVQIVETTSLRLVARNGAGTHARAVQVQAIPPARIVAFAGHPARRLTPGATVELSWTVADAVSIALEKNGVALPVGPTDFVATRNDTVDFDSHYVLTAVNSLGAPTVAELDVRAGAPTILSARAEPDFAGIGEAVTLRWTADGGETLTVTGPGGTELFRTTEPTEIDDGSTVVLLPLVSGSYDFTIATTNGAGVSDAAVVSVVASDGPMIRSFTANRATITLGQTVTVSWAVDDDVAGNTPTLALTDDHGGVHDVSALGPNVGSLAVTPAVEGPHVFTLTATTGPDRTVGRATLAVDVTVQPIAVSFAATPDTVSTRDGTVVPDVVLAWESRNAVEVSLWESDPAGNVYPPAFARLSLANGDPQATLDSGSLHVGPTQTTWYVVRVTNRVGSFVDLRVKVVVDPPEALTLEAVPNEIVAGENVQLTWTTKNATAASIDPIPVARLGNTFLDISPSGTGTGTQGALVGDTAREILTFPAGFTFPFGGADRTQLQVSTNGWAGFNTANTSNTSSPGQLPNDSYRYVNFSIFSGDLDSDEGVTPGALWYGPATDAQGDLFVIQWKNWAWWSSSYDVSDLNFELILRPNGSFEYRYANLQANGSTTADRANGVGSTIGFQFPANGSFGMTVVPSSARVAGLLSNSGFSFSTALPANGAVEVGPSATQTYTLTASNADSSATRQATVTVWQVPSLLSAAAMPAAPEATRPFRISWTAEHANRIRVLDDAGAEVCVVTDPAEVAAGSCTHAEATGGTKTYTVEAQNGLARNVVTRPVRFTVFPLLSLDSFTVSPGNFVSAGDTVTLTWTASGATEVMLLACTPHTDRTACVDITPAGANPAGDTFTQTMTGSVEFWLRVFDVQYRVRQASQEVWVDAPSLDGFTASATQIPAGASVTLAWTSTGASSASLSGVPVGQPVEVTSTAPFLDLTGTGTAATLATGDGDAGFFDVPFPADFGFPWFGSSRSSARVSTDGWLTFTAGYSTEHYADYALPTTSSTYQAVQLAPFWDDLQQGAEPLLYTFGQTADGVKYAVIEWKGWSFYSSSYNPSSLNFEVILYETGDVEFRYGTMTSSASYPNWAAGDSAAMGWQSPDRSAGAMLASPNGTPMTGGLANRSWRFAFSLPGDGSATVTPAESTTYRLCVTNASLYRDCDEIRVVVVRPGDVLFTELMIAPASADAEWFEVRNTALDPIDLAGWTITSGAGESFAVPATPPLPVAPGDFAVFARSAAGNGGLAPDVVYGAALGLDNVADELRLSFAGAAIDGVQWSGTGWPIQANQSIALEPSAMARSTAANDPGSAWCSTAAVYGDWTLAGSPGALGAGCLTGGANQWYVVDPVSAAPFLDISATGIDDSGILSSTYYTPSIPLGFTMPFFGDTVDTMQIGKHGYVAFTPQTTYYSSNTAIPSATTNPNGFVAAFWDSVYSTSGVSTLQHQLRTVGGHLVMIVQWTQVAGGSMSYGTLDFQIQLWDTGDVALVYRDVELLNTSYGYTLGSSATIGLENLAGDTAVQLFSGTSSTGSGPLYSGRSYLLHRR